MLGRIMGAGGIARKGLWPSLGPSGHTNVIPRPEPFGVKLCTGSADLPVCVVLRPCRRVAIAPPEAWRSGRVGFLPPVELAKLWALRVVLMKQGEKWDQYQWMGEQVTLVGGGHPSRDAVRRFFGRVDADPDWHPGKKTHVRGRPPVLTVDKRKRLAASAEALKKRH